MACARRVQSQSFECELGNFYTGLTTPTSADFLRSLTVDSFYVPLLEHPFHPLRWSDCKQLVEHIPRVVLLLQLLQSPVVITKDVPTSLIVVIVISTVMSE